MTDAVTIYHNPACGTSRNVLAMIRASGVEPKVVEYLETGWTREGLEHLFAEAGLTARDALRSKGELAQELGLAGSNVAADTILEAMVTHPILVERPFVVTARGTALCRPSERVLALLENPVQTFTKEDGEVVTR